MDICAYAWISCVRNFGFYWRQPLELCYRLLHQVYCSYSQLPLLAWLGVFVVIGSCAAIDLLLLNNLLGSSMRQWTFSICGLSLVMCSSTLKWNEICGSESDRTTASAWLPRLGDATPYIEVLFKAPVILKSVAIGGDPRSTVLIGCITCGPQAPHTSILLILCIIMEIIEI